MSDIGDLWREVREDTKKHRAKMLQQADTEGWTQHSPYHFSRIFGGERIDWWPSGGKAKYRGRMVYTHRKVNRLIAQLKEQELNEPKR